MSNQDFDFAVRIYRNNGEVGSSVLIEAEPHPVTGRPMFNDALTVFFDASYLGAFPELRLALRGAEEALERIVNHTNIPGRPVADSLISSTDKDGHIQVRREQREVVEERVPWSGGNVVRRFVREKKED